jgi:hypothetical protein
LREILLLKIIEGLQPVTAAAGRQIQNKLPQPVASGREQDIEFIGPAMVRRIESGFGVWEKCAAIASATTRVIAISPRFA